MQEFFGPSVKPYDMTVELELELQAALADAAPMPEYWQRRYESESVRNWDVFYKNTGDRFWPDRAWLQREFSELREDGTTKVMVEVGCGVGSTLFPSLMLNRGLIAGAYDCSVRAVSAVESRWRRLQESGIDPKSNLYEILNKPYVSGGQAESVPAEDSAVWNGGQLVDTATWDIRYPLSESSVSALKLARANAELLVYEDLQVADVLMCVFVLSAVPLREQAQAAQVLADCLVPGGVLIFRDYGLYDDKQLKLARHRVPKRVRENCYARHDGTLQTYFSCEEVATLFEAAGLVTLENDRCLREFNGVKRVWVQSRFRKPFR